ncbi:hypothetical protein Ddye_029356 [Dipteronia dyeriana]|uniref:BED-type domain-containing protein n=1 Tax=Dipteronia dyeriana TaxID=168575 RepID=A0AAD9TFD0_9ROSI|nr:hypothetical protein Ddye_029356 [Dipteronia dyeriana]
MSNSKSGSVSKGRARYDLAWKHCKEVESDDGKYYKYVVCNYCQQEIKGGVSRLKHHLAQTYKDGRKCPSVSDDVKDEMKKYLKIKENAKEAMEQSFDERVTIMSDGWTDIRERSLLNFLVNNHIGTVFMKSIDAFDAVKDDELIFKLLDSVMEEIGEDIVVQVVTDNASAYKATGRLLMEKRKHLYWTFYAAHCIDLILEDIEKLTQHKCALLKGRKVHIKKNRLPTTKMHKLVYIMYNKRLKDRYLRRQRLKENENPLIIDHVSYDDEWMVGDDDEFKIDKWMVGEAEADELGDGNQGTSSKRERILQ